MAATYDTLVDKKLFLLLTSLAFIVFIFTTDGHRYTIDEYLAHEQTKLIVTQVPHPLYKEGISTTTFLHPVGYGSSDQKCLNAILCSTVFIGHSLTQAPFYFLNHYFHFFTKENTSLRGDDFDDPHYIYWRNSQDPDFTFLEFFYGPFFSALSVGFFYLICRTFNYSTRTSVFISIIFGFSTTVWAYSKTSLNAVPEVSFILIAFFLFRKYQKTSSHFYLACSASSIGFAFLVRPDAVFFIIPLLIFLIHDMWKKDKKIKKLLAYLIPTISSYIILTVITFVRFGTSPFTTSSSSVLVISSTGSGPTPLYEGIFGLLFSPGAGQFVFVPILLSMFFAFPDFYKKNKRECILFLSFIVFSLLYYGSILYWHGLAGWGGRYLFALVAFMLIPLGASLEKRTNLKLKITLLGLAILGFFFNLVYALQDVSWFVWSLIGTGKGLFNYGPTSPLQIHPVIIWTFEYSQLTRSIVNLFENFQSDVFLHKLLGSTTFGVLFTAFLAPQIYLVYKYLKRKQ